MSDQAITAKLQELERECGYLHGSIRLCQGTDSGALHKACQELMERCCESEYILRSRVAGSRSPVDAALSEMELDYTRRTDELFTKYVSTGGKNGQDWAEALALYAEYAADHAIRTVRYAQMVALSAVGAQLEYE